MKDKDDISTVQSFIELGLCLVICLAAAVFGILFVPGEWYETMSKPSWTPPDHVFSWIWSALYIMMGSAVWIVWRQRRSTEITLPITVFTLQLFLNALWAFLFFGLHRLDLALIDAGLLLIVLTVAVIVFWKINALAGIFLIPYYLWMFFAVYLNYTVWRLNS